MNKYICLVDAYRRPSRQRNTSGRYIVCAKNEKEAKNLLQKAIGFGSVQVYYKVSSGSYKQEQEIKMKQGEMYKVNNDFSKGFLEFVFTPVKHATACKKEREIWYGIH